METIEHNIANIHQQIERAVHKYKCDSNTPTLLAVSKQQSTHAIKRAYTAGLRHFGENYLTEARLKIEQLSALNITWHYIGAIQSNKTRFIAEQFSWVHSVTEKKQAKRLDSQRPEPLPPLNVCIQVNISGESTKTGVSINELVPLATFIDALPHLTLRGLMAMPAPNQDFEQQRSAFRTLKMALTHLQEAGFAVDTLSMGTSQDFIAAIAEGATIIRLGTQIFGERNNAIYSE